MDIVKKHLKAILCGVMLVCMFLPFVKYSVSFLGQTMPVDSITCFNAVTHGVISAVLCFICVVLVAASDYVAQVAQYKKIGSLILSAVSVVLVFLIPGGSTDAVLKEVGGGQVGELAKSMLKSSNEIGFWLMIIAGVALTAVCAIRFFNLKGNPVFDFVNNEE